MRYALLAVLLALPITATAADMQAPAAPAAPATFAQRTAGLERHDGFIPHYLDTTRGRVLLEIPRLGEDVLYIRLACHESRVG
ncbi:MAG: hypothetical protein HY655_00610 [Acidobacteria bacterium]|nr:hypothetical protein [Acidobacteriota bacterium]